MQQIVDEPAAAGAAASPAQPAPLTAADLRADACARAGLADFGDGWFFEPMERYLAAVASEANLSDAGVAAQRETIVKGLVSRLRMVDDVKRHPEILGEQVSVAAIVLGLPRTGSTIFHRLLATAPGMTGVRWWECQNYAPFPAERPGEPAGRRAYAKAMLDGWLTVAPDLMSIHPLDIDGPDEEVIIMGQFFVSSMLEAMAYVPSFARWLTAYDQTRGYAELRDILKYLQWQDPSRRGCQWVLKSPSHLMSVEQAASVFPEALFVITHRDPLQTVPSYASMMQALYGMVSTRVDRHEVGAFWEARLADWMRLFMEARARLGEDRFVDVRYEDVVREPIRQAERVLARAGIGVDARMEAAMAEFLAGNKREQRAAHHYSLEEFGLSAAQVERDFAAYRARFL